MIGVSRAFPPLASLPGICTLYLLILDSTIASNSVTSRMHLAFGCSRPAGQPSGWVGAVCAPSRPPRRALVVRSMSLEAAHVRRFDQGNAASQVARRRPLPTARAAPGALKAPSAPPQSEHSAMQKLGQSWNSAGIALFARIALVRTAVPTACAPLASCCQAGQRRDSLHMHHGHRQLGQHIDAHHEAWISQQHALLPPRLAFRGTSRWRCRTSQCPTFDGSTGVRCARPASRAACSTRTTRSQVRVLPAAEPPQRGVRLTKSAPPCRLRHHPSWLAVSCPRCFMQQGGAPAPIATSTAHALPPQYLTTQICAAPRRAGLPHRRPLSLPPLRRRAVQPGAAPTRGGKPGGLPPRV